MRYKITVNHDASIIDFLVEPIKFHLAFGNLKIPKLPPYLPLRIHIPDAVGFKQLPFFRRVFRQVSGSSFVCLGRLAWNGEVSDQVGAFLELFSPNI